MQLYNDYDILYTNTKAWKKSYIEDLQDLH